jgi:hypothetical protein
MPRVNVWIPADLYAAAKAGGLNVSAASQDGVLQHMVTTLSLDGGVKAKPETKPSALYRFWSEDAELLYVGMSTNLGHRIDRHGEQKDWWPEVASIHVELFPDGEEAHAAEIDAIRSECPRYNVHRYPLPPLSRRATPGWKPPPVNIRLGSLEIPVREAAEREGIPLNRWICNAVRYVLDHPPSDGQVRPSADPDDQPDYPKRPTVWTTAAGKTAMFTDYGKACHPPSHVGERQRGSSGLTICTACQGVWP